VNAGYKTAHSANVSAGPVRKKLQQIMAGNGSEGSSAQNSSIIKKTPTKRKTPATPRRKAVKKGGDMDEDRDEGDDIEETPSKKRLGAKGKAITGQEVKIEMD